MPEVHSSRGSKDTSSAISKSDLLVSILLLLVRKSDFLVADEVASFSRVDKTRQPPAQRYLEQKAAAGCSFSVVDHLRWDLRAIFRLATQDRLLPSNPAEMLFTPPTLATPSRRVLTPEQVQQILQVLPVREQVDRSLGPVLGHAPR